ncbi:MULTISPECIES: hydroxyacylglutathione hydrolase [unclassified Sphingomonas]|uniref:hydroxyacylglutathione hydrolase n=1 Tax=unclassified Sphingomonas TaxID=196159 RepID=UPI00070186BD|nr:MULTISPECIES: hydroxyacylglutathione hydrolase [unclassified Sphingomonas]KQX19636.1 hydroxyacylglutathione hydrolase [Sphingomonas sp. Root1294]KQY65837.1 hydroxyacylglutathione hydrolase [Sphingomonas sp. Root50]KRB94856.1 hydroxyacylglutathione hydrolase [Sphingomonas sp. Root720]
MLEVVGVPVLADNYVWLMHDAASRETVVVDPAVDAPVLAAAALRGWRISQIWNTHWHDDHVGGNTGIKAATGCRIIAPDDPEHPIPGVDRIVGEGDRVGIGAFEGHVLSTPGHTKVHLTYHLPDAAILFTGDTLFALGCGRLFEGTAEQMFANMRRLAALPPDTAVYCAHEYTQSNARFAVTVEPDNATLAERSLAIDAARAAGRPTVPTTIAAERDTNPFLRAATVAAFASRRAAKDVFRG